MTIRFTVCNLKKKNLNVSCHLNSLVLANLLGITDIFTHSGAFQKSDLEELIPERWYFLQCGTQRQERHTDASKVDRSGLLGVRQLSQTLLSPVVRRNFKSNERPAYCLKRWSVAPRIYHNFICFQPVVSPSVPCRTSANQRGVSPAPVC